MSPFDNLVFLDFETCDLDPSRAPVIELGAVGVVNGLTRFKLQALVRADLSQANPKAMQVNGISAEQVAAGLEPRTAFALLRNCIGSAVVVCHNAAFDIAHLSAAYQQLGGQPFNHSFLCTKVLARHVLGLSEKETSLAALCRRAGIPRTQSHRALGDALDTAQLCYWLLSLWLYRGGRLEELEVLLNKVTSHEHWLGAHLPEYSLVYAPVVEIGEEVPHV